MQPSILDFVDPQDEYERIIKIVELLRKENKELRDYIMLVRAAVGS